MVRASVPAAAQCRAGSEEARAPRRGALFTSRGLTQSGRGGRVSRTQGILGRAEAPAAAREVIF